MLNETQVQQTMKRGRDLLSENGSYDAVMGKRSAAEGNSVHAHQVGAAANSSNDPKKHLDAAKSHLYAADDHDGLASYHHGTGKKSTGDEHAGKCQAHKLAAHDHASKAANLLKPS